MIKDVGYIIKGELACSALWEFTSHLKSGTF
ncbi:hypothetical protein J4730_28910 [Klebsiella pneumoniae]|uniref:Uncharacterized protein n=1 Tax=Klebsiella pneumoniae TaxID=573 RepID=A0A939NNE5_KLEPN|nr:hypothetical protein [Klebsiella pneumoniae]